MVAVANAAVDFTTLDFSTNKNSLINFLRGQAILKDYDFTGSNLNVLIDLLSKNTEKIGFYTNMAIAEAFIDSAQLQSSIFSGVKPLNYTPRSIRSAKATVRVDFTASGENQPYVIQKGRSFSTLIKNESYTFTIPETLVVSSANTKFSFTTDIYEGVYVKDSYVFTSDQFDPYPTFALTNPTADTTSLTVAVYENGNQVAENYQLATTLLGLDSTSRVYFLQPSDKGGYEVLFGDGVLGRVPAQNATIVLDYRVSRGSVPNGAGVFTINFDPTGPNTEIDRSLKNNPGVTTLTASAGGAEPETVESVRYYAPRAFQVQERAVIPSDYAILLKTNFPEIEAVDVYGGEDESPPEYRNVIVSLVIAGVDGLPDSKRLQYYQFLKSRNPMTIDIVFKDPVFTYLAISTLVRYNVNKTPSSPSLISTLVSDAVTTFSETNLNDFGVTLRYSKLVETIDDVDPAIVSNITAIRLYKKTNPVTGVAQNLALDFGTAFASGQIDEASAKFGATSVIESTIWTLKGERVLIRDDGKGSLFAVRQSDGTQVQGLGTVDYKNGIVAIQNLNPDDYDGSFLKIYARPSDLDVKAARRNILMVEPDEIGISVSALSE